MRGELLAFKYRDLKFGFQYSASAITSLGWNIRKRYLRHANDEHIKNNLSKFADQAVNHKVIDYETLSAANDSLLQAQKWRWDKEKFSIDPPHEEIWDRVYALLVASADKPAIILNYLRKNCSDVALIQKNELQNVFLRMQLIDLLRGTVGDHLDGLEEIDCTQSDQLVLSRLTEFSSKCEELSALFDVQDVYAALEMFGLPPHPKIQEFPDPSDIELATEAAVTVTQASLASEKFFDVQYFQENINIRMNDNNSCIQVILDNEDLLLFFEKVLKAYVKSSENMQSHSKIIEDFTTYFSLFLDREFSE
jgi:hypothetical protein